MIQAFAALGRALRILFCLTSAATQAEERHTPIPHCIRTTSTAGECSSRSIGESQAHKVPVDSKRDERAVHASAPRDRPSLPGHPLPAGLPTFTADAQRQPAFLAPTAAIAGRDMVRGFMTCESKQREVSSWKRDPRALS
eukprot:5384891-Pleurochrysis_carterae.AAC.5